MLIYLYSYRINSRLLFEKIRLLEVRHSTRNMENEDCSFSLMLRKKVMVLNLTHSAASGAYLKGKNREAPLRVNPEQALFCEPAS